MTDLKISGKALAETGKMLRSAAAEVEKATAPLAGDLGHHQVVSAATQAANDWHKAATAISSALQSEDRQVTSAAIIFQKVDQVLAGKISNSK